MRREILLSPLSHTWIFDIDGTLVKHNGYLTPEGDALLEGAAEFFVNIPPNDMIILVTARPSEYRAVTEKIFGGKPYSLRPHNFRRARRRADSD